MQLFNTPMRYGLVARILHWTSVALVGWLFLGISGIDVPPKLHARDAVVANHAAVGLALLVLMGVRLAWRLGNPNPLLRYRLAPWRRALALGIHRCLYLLIAGGCLSGLVALLAAGGPLPLSGARATPDAAIAGTALGWHDRFATALLLLVVVHAGAAMLHQIADIEKPPEAPR